MENEDEKVCTVVTLPKRALKVLLLEAEELGIIRGGKGHFAGLLMYYAEEMKKQPGQPIRLYKKYARSFRGHKVSKWVWLPRWARDTLRERARRRGFVHAKKAPFLPF
jgi:hypothetical protein